MEIKQKQRNQLVYKYFIKTPDKPNYTGYFIGIAIFALLMLIGFSQRGGMAVFLGLIGLVGLGIVFKKFYTRKKEYTDAFNRAEPKATDKQMDDWFEQGKQMVIAEARKRLDIDADDELADAPMIDGPADGSYLGPGTDRVLRFNKHNILLIFLTDHNVATFQCILDLGLGEILQDRTKEFPYKDITNLETQTANQNFHYRNEEKIAIKGLQTLSLYTSGGNVISVNYIFSKNTGTGTDDYIYPNSNAENTIRAIRKRLKDYKDNLSSESRQL